MAENSETISVNNVSFSYRTYEDDSRKKALDGVSLQIRRGSYTAVLGPNGSGKSTLAKLIDILELPDEGRVTVFGIDTANEEKFWEIRETCSCVFQNPDNQIVGTTVEEDIAFGPENLGIPNPELRKRVDYAMEKTGLTELAERQAATLSGGQKQKLAIAGVLAMQPQVLILDEATAMLDPEARDEFLELVEKMQAQKGWTVITITHDMSEAARCEQVFVIKDGKLVDSGRPEDLFCRENEMQALGLDCPVYVKLTGEIAGRAGCELKAQDVSSQEACAEKIAEILSKKENLQLKSELHREARNEVLMEIQDLSYSYDGENDVLHDISFDVKKGEILSVVGKSGCGKTTLISHFNALNRPQKGDVVIRTSEGELHSSNKKQIKDIRHTVGLVFQYPEYQLFEETVYKDIAYGPSKMGIRGDELDKRVRDAARAVNLPDDVLEVSPFDLSGGQKRRVAMAGVIAMNPEILVLDEPASGLDPKGRRDMFALIRKLRDNGTTIILVSHNMDEAAEFSDRICCIKDGRVALIGTPEEVFENKEKIKDIGLASPKLQSFMELAAEKISEKTGKSLNRCCCNSVNIDEAADTLIKFSRGENNA